MSANRLNHEYPVSRGLFATTLFKVPLKGLTVLAINEVIFVTACVAGGTVCAHGESSENEGFPSGRSHDREQAPCGFAARSHT